jgi:hypothetical protein
MPLTVVATVNFKTMPTGRNSGHGKQAENSGIDRSKEKQ